HLFGWDVGFTAQFVIIAVVTVLFIISAWTGLSKGIKYLSNTNMVLAVILLIVVLAVGPTILILDMFTDTFGKYLQNIIKMSFRTAPLEGDNRGWHDSWTIFF